MRLTLYLASGALLTVSTIAHADTLNFTFALESSPGSPSTYSGLGSFSIVTSPGQTVYDLSDGLEDFSASYDTLPLTGQDLSVTLVGGQVTALNGYAFPAGTSEAPDGLILLTTFLYGTDYVGLAETPDPHDPGHYDHYGYVVGDITFAATPEPSTFVLLGTGLLGAAAAMRPRGASTG